MNNIPLYVGVDYHQDQLQICVLDPAGHVRLNRPCPNRVADAARLLADCGQVRAVAIEACCGSADFGEQLAAAGPWRVELAHAGYVAKLKGSPDKTDFSDARLLADLTRVGYLPRVWLPPAEIRDLRQLVGHRQRLVDQRRALKLQVGAVFREQRIKLAGSRWSGPWTASARDNENLSEQARWIVNELLEEILHVGSRLKLTETRLREATIGDEQVKRLRTIEGVGEVTAWMLRAWIGRFDRFKSGKQLSRYCGLSPRNASSGKRSSDGGLIDAANKQLRAVLIQAGHRLIRTHERWRKLAASLRSRGKCTCVVVAAVANRWVRSMHHRMIGPAATEAGKHPDAAGATEA